MTKFIQIPYAGKDHGTFDQEWMCRRDVSEWWYATGVINDENGKMYSYQFTLIRAKIGLLKPYLIMLALTDFARGKHHYYQDFTFSAKHIRIDSGGVSYTNVAAIGKDKYGMKVNVTRPDFSLDLTLTYGKGAVWHCDNGLLQMGLPGARQTTIYASYTNMPTTGILVLGGAKHSVTGKTWFDKQGGPYSLTKPACMWEWFSLRFDDNEEIMLFYFPHNDYRDGTYILADGTSERLQAYTVEALDFVCPDGQTKYSCLWKLTIPNRKDEVYTIKPLMDGQMNMGYFELLAEIINPAGLRVGLCFVELLPGARNKKISMKLFRKSSAK